MSVTFTDNRNTELDQADSTTGWTGSVTVTLKTSEPDPIETTGCLGMAVSTSTDDAYTSITSDNYSSGGTLSFWVQANGAMDNQVNGGIQIVVGDGTNRIGYHVGGSDKSAFRHEDGPVKWECYILDLANKPTNSTDFAGTEANLDETAITQVGVAFKTLSKAVGNATNCFWDISRFADNAQDIEMQGGSTSGTAGNGSEAAAIDRSTGNTQAYGVIRQLGSGIYGIQGNLSIGSDSTSSNQYWEETNTTYAWEDRGLSSNNYYRFIIQGSASATNNEVIFTSCTFTVPSTTSASFNANDTNIDVCNIIRTTFIGFDQGIETSQDTGDSWINNSYIDNDQITANGCDLSGGSISGYLGVANTSALLYNLAVDPDGELDNMSFTMGTNDTHAIEFGTSIPSEITLRGMTFSSTYNQTTDNTNNAHFHFKDTGGTITVNLLDCDSSGAGGSTFTYRTDGATINLVIAPKTTKVTCENQAGTLLENVRVFLETADNGGGTGLPYQAGVSTLTQTGGTATLTASSVHGLATDDYVVIRGASDEYYNKTAQITVTSTTVFTYSVNTSAGASAGGTPVFSYCPISGLTNTLGVISSQKTWPASQGVTGWARKSTASPFYKESPLSIADASGGTDLLVLMIGDE